MPMGDQWGQFVHTKGTGSTAPTVGTIGFTLTRQPAPGIPGSIAPVAAGHLSWEQSPGTFPNRASLQNRKTLWMHSKAISTRILVRADPLKLLEKNLDVAP